MESFFGRMKCELLDLIALCPNADTVAKMIDGYMEAYNNQHYQYALAGLTPSDVEGAIAPTLKIDVEADKLKTFMT